MSMPRIGIGGPVGTGKTSLLEAIVPIFVRHGYEPLIITNDVVTKEDAHHVREALAGIVHPDRIVGVETGACPHTAIREDPAMNLAALHEIETSFPTGSLVLIESGGDNLTLTFSPALADYFVYVIDVAAWRQDPAQERARHHALGPARDQQGRPGSVRGRGPGRHAQGRLGDAPRWQPAGIHQLPHRRGHR